MSATLELPLPRLTKGCFASISALTDEALFSACGVRIAFTLRGQGVSTGPYQSLNLGDHVGDDPFAVQENRRILCEALGAKEQFCLTPHQVHGKNILTIPAQAKDQQKFDDLAKQAKEGADALLVEATGIAALLCFADCVPVIIVSPSGRFAVVHAGWRGVINKIAAKAFRQIYQLDTLNKEAVETKDINVYIGPYIHAGCFEAGKDLIDQFAESFGFACIPDAQHIDLGAALRISLQREGANMKRVADANLCTHCNTGDFFSYRAFEGVCGRHGAFAIRK